MAATFENIASEFMRTSLQLKMAILVVLLLVIWYYSSTCSPKAKMTTLDYGVGPKWWYGNSHGGRGGSVDTPTNARQMLPFYPQGKRPGDQHTAAGPTIIDGCCKRFTPDCSRTDPAYWDKLALEEIQALARLEAVDMRDRDVIARSGAVDTAFSKKGSSKMDFDGSTP